MKSPLKMVVWNRPRGIRSQGCFFVSPRLGKSKKRVLNGIGRRSSTQLFALPSKAHSKWWYETDLVEFDPKGVFSFRPDWESRKNAFWTELDDVRQPGFCPAWKSPLKMVVWNRPRGIRSQGCFFASPRLGKSKKRVLNAIGRRSSTRLFALLEKAHSKWWYETDLVEFDTKGVFSYRPDGESRKNAFWTELDHVRQPGFLPCLEKPTQNGGMKPTSWNSIPRVFFSFPPDWESRKNAFWTELDDVRQPGFLPCHQKPTQNGGMKPTSWNSIARVFFRFAPIGKVEKTRFERNWTTFVNPAFCPAWKSPLKMVVWNRPRGIRSQGCFFVSPRWGKSKKRVLNGIGRRSSTRLFALLGKAHSKWWHETDLVEFNPKGVFSFRPDGESRKNAFWTELDDVRQPGFLPCLEKPTQNGLMKPTSWNSIPRVFFSFRPDGESRKNAFWTQLDDVRQPGFLRCLEKPTQNGGMKPTSWNSIPRVFFRFAPMGKVEKTRFERNWTTFVNPAFCPAWKSPLKMVAWNRPRGIQSKGCFFVSPRWGKSKKRVLNGIGRRSSTRLFALLGKAHSKWSYETDLVEFNPKGVFFVSPWWGKSKKRVLNAIGRRSSTRLFALLGKAHSKWWYETDLVEFDPKGVFSFRPDGESRKNAFWTELDDVRQPGFLPCLEKPTQNGLMKPTSWNSIPRVFFSFRPDGESRKNAFWTQLDDVRQPGFLRCLEKPTQNGGMKPTSWNSIQRVFFRFAPMGKVEKTRSERNRTTFVNPAFCPAWKSPLKMVVWNRPRGIQSQGCFFRFAPMGKVEKTRSERNRTTFVNPAFCPAWKSPLKMVVWNRPRGIQSQGCFFRFAPMGKVEKTRSQRNRTTFVNPAFCPAWKSPLKMVVWNRPRGIRSQGCFVVSPRWGKSKKRVLNAIGRRSSTRLFALQSKAHSKWWYETDLVEFDPKGVFSFRPDGESRKNAFWTQLDDVRQPGFFPCLEKPTQNGGMKPTSWNSIPRVFFRFAPMGKVEKTRFEQNWTTFVNPAFALLGKAHSKWWYETDLMEFDP